MRIFYSKFCFYIYNNYVRILCFDHLIFLILFRSNNHLFLFPLLMFYHPPKLFKILQIILWKSLIQLVCNENYFETQGRVLLKLFVKSEY